jgi:cytochrome b pre-mRNA-processing protein 3
MWRQEFMNALLRLLGLKPSANIQIVDRLYAGIVEAARSPRIYAGFGAPDTPLGRFEVLSAHMAIVLHAVREAKPAVKAVVQELTEEFFKDVDHSLRELGIGDAGIPKRMKKMASMFYGRLDSYARALDASDQAALADALARNVAPESGLRDAAAFAAYMQAASAKVMAQAPQAFLDGSLTWPDETEATKP